MLVAHGHETAHGRLRLVTPPANSVTRKGAGAGSPPQRFARAEAFQNVGAGAGFGVRHTSVVSLCSEVLGFAGAMRP